MSKDIVGKCLLLNLLNKRYMTQVDLSEKTGISKQQINEYIANTRLMTIYNAKLIADVLDCCIDDLYEWKLRRR
ncbi:helix-turn-helix transcriptional regulator [Bacillus sp. UMB0728]|uniref:helix-turn-helix transcriptional regulator n=1 Tax=Bacillus sp. UMB0728 TaxID=2066052 RepID=UPI000C76B4B1|nr:helix-turn-helix transcriptional regulator [Bacillus sp. UMB0728]PLR72222.1 XRE family transcriptional regulator [Bacillus sp. UMB0728]